MMACVIDCHYHLDERILAVNEMISRMNACGIDKAALMASLNDPLPEPPRPLIRILQFLLFHPATQKTGRIFIDNFTPEGDIRIGRKAYRIYAHPDNNEVFKIVEKLPDRFLGWVFIHPNSGTDQVKELEKWITHPGFIGVKAHPFWHRFEPLKLLPIADLLIGKGKPLLIHAGYGSHGDFMALAEKAPELKLILAHAGFPGYRSTWKLIKNHKNIFVDLSQTTYVSDDATRNAVEFLGYDRCLFGTDGPYGFHAKDGKFDYSYIKRRIERLFPSQKIREHLLGQNFIDITGIT
jgi:predicted TIM-barrel fold metal-dependent hydrolase